MNAKDKAQNINNKHNYAPELFSQLNKEIIENLKTDFGEVKRYMGYPPEYKDIELDKKISRMEKQIKQISTPKFLIRVFPLSVKTTTLERNKVDTGDIISKIKIHNSIMEFESNNLADHLKGSSQIVIMAATLGIQVDQQIARYNRNDLEKSVIFDATASAFVEAICDYAENILRESTTKQGFILTSRFSPGYGDLSIEMQPDILQTIDAPRKIGLYTNNHNVLNPSKSVTAFLGISKEQGQQDIKKINEEKLKDFVIPDGCKKCLQYKNCYFLKRGEYCEVRRKALQR